jgi:hypothetical protein
MWWCGLLLLLSISYTVADHSFSEHLTDKQILDILIHPQR